MKKILSVILSALIILSVFSVGAFAAEAEPTRFQKWMNEYESDKGIAFNINTRIDGFLIGFLKCTAYIKGGQSATLIDFDGTELKLVSKDGDIYIYPAKFPFVHYKMDSAGFFVSDDTSGIGYSFDGEYELELEDKTYFVEEYTFVTDGEEYQLRACFDGDELVNITHGQTIADMDIELEFEVIPGEIDDEVFETPFFSLDVTFLVDMLMKFGIFPII